MYRCGRRTVPQQPWQCGRHDRVGSFAQDIRRHSRKDIARTAGIDDIGAQAFDPVRRASRPVDNKATARAERNDDGACAPGDEITGGLPRIGMPRNLGSLTLVDNHDIGRRKVRTAARCEWAWIEHCRCPARLGGLQTGDCHIGAQVSLQQHDILIPDRGREAGLKQGIKGLSACDAADDNVFTAGIDHDRGAVGRQLQGRHQCCVEFLRQHLADGSGRSIRAGGSEKVDRSTCPGGRDRLVGPFAADAIAMAVGIQRFPGRAKRSRRNVVSMQTLPTTWTRMDQSLVVAQASICSNRVL